MSAEIASAFVRIRPNLTGFKAETETGVTSAFSGAFRKAATLVGVGFGAKAAFDFTKSLIGDAANVQKQIEVIQANFGKAGQQIIKFGENAGIGLGIANHLTEQTGARFGILFKNLGIGQQQASGMTVGLLKLAGSLAAIRGVDPATVLERLPLALAGNLRSLKQMGLALDASQIKLAALKLGLISSTKDAITPAIKAQAIYALATAHLGAFQEQAKKHAGDLANVQRRLSAEWDHAKEQLGKALLPEITKLVSHFAKWFEKMQRGGKLQKDFNAIAKTTESVVRKVGEAIRTGWTIFKTAVGWVGGLKKALEIFLAVIAVRKILAIATAIRTQLIANGFRSLQVTVAETQAEYIAAFGSMEVATLGLSATIKAALISTGIGAIAVALGIAAVEIMNHWKAVKRFFVEFGTWIKNHAYVLFAVPIVGQFAYIVVKIVENFDAIKKAAVAVAHFFRDVWTHPIRAIEDLFHSLEQAVGMVWRNMEKDALHAALMIVEPFSHLPGFLGGGPFRKLKDWINGQLDGLDVKGIGQKVAKQMATDFHHRGDTVAPAVEIGKTIGKTIGKATTDAITKTVSGGTNGIAASVAKATEAAAALAKQRIESSVEAAKKNLDDIGAKLSDSINKILDKLGSTGKGIAGSPQAVAFRKLRDLISGGASSVEVERAAQQLSSSIAARGSGAASSSIADRRAKVKASIASLTNEFNRGVLSLAQFNRKVAALLKKEGVTYKIAGKAGGAAFADGFRAEIKGLHDQAAAIAAVPANLRRAGGGGGAADIRIIRPLETIRIENQRIAQAAARQRERQIRAAEKAATAAEKMAAVLKAVGSVHLGMLPGKTAKKARDATKAGIRP